MIGLGILGTAKAETYPSSKEKREMVSMAEELIPEEEKDSFELYCRLMETIEQFARENGGRIKLETIEHAMNATLFTIHERIILRELVTDEGEEIHQEGDGSL
jgi:hypothetical protein